ncbi:MAG: hypothetical protein LBB98_08355 [Treponema sp.]|jgi:hypothetical protein|nr:hypothetical protein [Treponema sp.]
MIRQIDLNAYCAGHLSGSILNDRIVAFPQSFVTEAKVLGAAAHRTGDGFETVQYLFEEPEALLGLPCIAEAEPVRRVLEQIRGAPKDKTLLLKANGPYSILASLIDPRHLYRWLVKHRPTVRQALDRITADLAEYLCAAAACGVSIISLADPYANLEVLGEKRYREFAAPFLMRLMRDIASGVDGCVEKPGVLLHLCPTIRFPSCGWDTWTSGISRSNTIHISTR